MTSQPPLNEDPRPVKERPTFLGNLSSTRPFWKNFLKAYVALQAEGQEEGWKYALQYRKTWKMIAETAWLFITALIITIVVAAAHILDPLILMLSHLWIYLTEVVLGHTTIYKNSFQLYQNLEWSASDFYDSIEENLKDFEIPDRIRFSRIRLWESSLFSPRRLYLKIRRRGFVIYVCGAPYGNQYFFSWYLASKKNPVYTLLYKIMARTPIIGSSLVKQQDKQTFYRHDTASAFSLSVAEAIRLSIEGITNGGGIRNGIVPEIQTELDASVK